MTGGYGFAVIDFIPPPPFGGPPPFRQGRLLKESDLNPSASFLGTSRKAWEAFMAGFNRAKYL